MDPWVEDEVKRLVHDLSDLFLEFGVTKEQIHEIAINDIEFQLDRHIVGEPLDYCEWREHPTIKGGFCSTNGKFRFNGIEIPAVEDPRHNGRLSFVVKHGNKTFSYPAAGTILSCFVPKPEVGTYQVCFRNNNQRDIRVSNMYWFRLVK